jgi:monovalent cation:H+ antiporter-2, CPA2 family
MVATPFLTALGVALSRRVQRAQVAAVPEPAASAAAPAELENHVVVAGYGEAARRLVRVLHGSHIPFLITTLSPLGANEAEADGLPVLRGDSSKQHTLRLAGVERAKLLTIADDDPATARRIAAVARELNPTMRVLVRTRYLAEVEPLTAVGVDRVIADELESVVQLFADVMRSYNLSAAEIEANEDTIRGAGYAALRTAELPRDAVVECVLGPDCLDRRRVAIRAAAPAAGQSLSMLRLTERFAIQVEGLQRGDTRIDAPPADTVLQPGDELRLAGAASAFAQAAPLFRVGPMSEAEAGALDEAAAQRRIDTERSVELHPTVDDPHTGQIRTVRPSAPGCEDCLRSGDRWVHLRICMTCGHVGCCDSSPNKHATAHFHQTTHPIMRSLEPGEEWGWCFVDERQL